MSRRSESPLPELVVADATALKECVRYLSDCPVIGFDTEFVGEDTYRPDLCLIQVAAKDHLFVIDPLSCGSLDSFWKLLHDPLRVVIAHASREEIRLCRFASGQPPGNLFDTQIAAGFIGLTYPISYAGLVQETLSLRLTKGDTLSDWRRRPLSPSQMRYAFDDVRFLIPAWEKINSRLLELGRTLWTQEEFATHVRWATNDDATQERWRKIKGVGALKRKELAVARAVYQWRDITAEKWNRPPRAVLRDDLLIELARTGARSPDDVHHLRGLPKNHVEAIRTVVRQAAALPISACPVIIGSEIDPPQVATIASLLNVVLADVCARIELAPSLVATQYDLKELVRSTLPGSSGLPEDSVFNSGWRRDVVLPELRKVLSGRTVVRVANSANSDPLDYPDWTS